MGNRIFDFICRYILAPIFFVSMCIVALISYPFFLVWMFFKKRKKNGLAVLCLLSVLCFLSVAILSASDPQQCTVGTAQSRGRCTARLHIARDFHDIGKVVDKSSLSDKKYRCEVLRMRVRYIRSSYKEYYDSHNSVSIPLNRKWWKGYISWAEEFLRFEKSRVERHCKGEVE